MNKNLKVDTEEPRKNPRMARSGACHSPEARAKAGATRKARHAAAKAVNAVAETEERLSRDIVAEFEEAIITRQPDGSFSWTSHDPEMRHELGEVEWEGTFKVADDGSVLFNTRMTDEQAEYEEWLKGEDWKSIDLRDEDPERWAAEVRKRNRPVKPPTWSYKP